MTENPRARSYA